VSGLVQLGGRKAALRVFRRGLVVEGRVGPAVVVPLRVFFAEDFCLQQRCEGFAVEELVPEPAVEAFAVGVLAGTARLDVEGLEPALADPVLHRRGHEFGAVFAADVVGHAAARGPAWSRMWMTSCASIFRSTSSATSSRPNSSQIGSHLSRRPSSVWSKTKSQPHTWSTRPARSLWGAAGALAEALSLALSAGHFEPFLPPQSADALGVDLHPVR
jgi:hypothetical protein